MPWTRYDYPPSMRHLSPEVRWARAGHIDAT